MVFFAALAGLPGCITMRSSSETARTQEDLLLMQEDLGRTRGRLESLEMEYQRVLRELEATRSAAASGKGETSSTPQRLNELERRVNLLEEARVKDRQAIIDQLSGKLAEIVGGGSGQTSRKVKPVTDVISSNAEGLSGYEHVVQEGETLSAIATAYKVKVAAIIEANKLQNPDTLLKGQKLFIPQP
ncbi:MAG: LysM peptidoglycan-binding domain-containing protein [Lentisphaerae bacterium]|nr:LysM peptidoglycan-binding domain-containing protein [Lentisphaerota bacterium]